MSIIHVTTETNPGEFFSGWNQGTAYIDKIRKYAIARHNFDANVFGKTFS